MVNYFPLVISSEARNLPITAQKVPKTTKITTKNHPFSPVAVPTEATKKMPSSSHKGSRLKKLGGGIQ